MMAMALVVSLVGVPAPAKVWNSSALKLTWYRTGCAVAIDKERTNTARGRSNGIHLSHAGEAVPFFHPPMSMCAARGACRTLTRSSRGGHRGAPLLTEYWRPILKIFRIDVSLYVSMLDPPENFGGDQKSILSGTY
jgi:hypothetical protein